MFLDFLFYNISVLQRIKETLQPSEGVGIAECVFVFLCL
jgi:hypothetical protein